eukprot:gene5098-biopygen3642
MSGGVRGSLGESGKVRKIPEASGVAAAPHSQRVLMRVLRPAAAAAQRGGSPAGSRRRASAAISRTPAPRRSTPSCAPAPKDLWRDMKKGRSREGRHARFRTDGREAECEPTVVPSSPPPTARRRPSPARRTPSRLL